MAENDFGDRSDRGVRRIPDLGKGADDDADPI